MGPIPTRPGGIRWKWGIWAAAAVTLLGLFPQINLWVMRGREWNGSYALFYGDEMVYSAYVNALIDGRPRRNDPFTGIDDRPDAPMQESHLSIQFLPAYLIALPARALGVSAATAFIVVGFLTALGSSLAIFWLLATLTGDGRLAAAGVLFVLCFGTLAGWEGMGHILYDDDTQFTKLLFLRRYQPALMFPLFFVFCLLSWHALTDERRRLADAHAVLAGLLLSAFIFSYFYLWTAAAAWLACLLLLWLVARPAECRRVIRTALLTGAPAALALIPYTMMLANRAQTMDIRQTLEFTRAPDLWRVPELIGAVIVLALAFALRRGALHWRNPKVLFALAFALTPFVVFNQQIITNRSVQPFHYEVFITNYLVLVGPILAAILLWHAHRGAGNEIPARLLRFIAVVSFLWGAVEVIPVTLLAKGSLFHDSVVPVARRLNELARHDGSLTEKNNPNSPCPVVLSTDIASGMYLTTYAPQAVLFSSYNMDFPNVTADEYRERFYKNLYYSGVNGEQLYRALRNESDDRDFIWNSRTVLFGHERVSPILSREFKPATEDEIQNEVRKYLEYTASFSFERAADHRLSYVITQTDAATDFSNLDRWYQRDTGECIGDFTLYRVRLRH